MASLIKQLAEEMEAKDHRIAELEAKLADAAARPEIRRQSAMQMVIGISLITKACPDASFQEIHDMWAAHADKDAAEQKRKDEANASPAALRSLLGSWLSGGMPEDKCLCACLEPGCPTFEKVYVRGRGFVSRYELEREAEEAEEHEAEEHEAEEHEEWDCSCMTPECCFGGCETSEIARDLFSSTGVRASNAEIAAVKRERYARAPFQEPPPSPPPLRAPAAAAPSQPKKSWAQIAAGRPLGAKKA